jgi:DNA relaxase NicK
MIKKHWSEMRAWSAERVRSPDLKLIVGQHGPETLYSGRRSSDVYLRCYDRGAKAKDERFAGHLRYEVEFKSHRARFILSQMLRSESDHLECAAQCLKMFRDRGCRLPAPKQPASLFQCPPRTTDVDKRLTWLRNQVQCTVQSLVALGYLSETLDALGLNDVVPRRRGPHN